MKDGKLGIALVGLGTYSTEQLAPALQQTEHCYLAGIVSGSPEKISKWKEKYNLPDEALIIPLASGPNFLQNLFMP